MVGGSILLLQTTATVHRLNHQLLYCLSSVVMMPLSTGNFHNKKVGSADARGKDDLLEYYTRQHSLSRLPKSAWCVLLIREHQNECSKKAIKKRRKINRMRMRKGKERMRENETTRTHQQAHHKPLKSIVSFADAP